MPPLFITPLRWPLALSPAAAFHFSPLIDFDYYFSSHGCFSSFSDYFYFATAPAAIAHFISSSIFIFTLFAMRRFSDYFPISFELAIEFRHIVTFFPPPSIFTTLMIFSSYFQLSLSSPYACRFH
jgi:hypothetical protein